MGTSYVRQDVTNNIENGNTSDADVLDAEFDRLQSAFAASTGHSHDGTSGEGGPITKLGPAQEVNVSANTLSPATGDVFDVGTISAMLRLVFSLGYVAGDGLIVGNKDQIASITVANPGTDVNAIRTLGSTTAGDGNEEIYVYSATEPAHSNKVQSADGAWWELGTLHPHNVATTSVNGFMSAADKTKLDGIDTGAEVNSYATKAQIRTGTEASTSVSPNSLADSKNWVTLTDAATIAWDVSSGFNFTVTITGNRTIGTPSGLTDIVGRSGFFRIVQDAVGSHTIAVDAAIEEISGSDVATALGSFANDVTMYSYVVLPGPAVLMYPIGVLA